MLGVEVFFGVANVYKLMKCRVLVAVDVGIVCVLGQFQYRFSLLYSVLPIWLVFCC